MATGNRREAMRFQRESLRVDPSSARPYELRLLGMTETLRKFHERLRLASGSFGGEPMQHPISIGSLMLLVA
jgi:hypothetical protein